MIPTVYIIYCGRKLEVPVIKGEPLPMPYNSWNHWPESFCGAGQGIGNWAVPEKAPGGTVFTPCCFIHDVTNELAKTVEEYAQSDRMFCKNLVEAVFCHHPLDVVDKKDQVDILWVAGYYAAVDSTK